MIEYRVEGPVARITLNRPEKRNAIHPSMIQEMGRALERARVDETVRVVLLSGAGPDFCAGMDIALLRETADSGVLEHLQLASSLGDLFRALRRHPRPVIAAVTGRALGGGAGIAMSCDVILAAESAQFGYPEVKIGFVPAIVMSMLRRSVGEKKAFDLLTSAEPVSAREALALGLVTRVYPEAGFPAAVAAYASALAEKSPSAIRLTKQLLYQIDGMGFDAAIDAGVQINAIGRMTEDARRGFERFVKK